MATITFTIGSATATHDISAEHQARLLECMKTRMSQAGAWPEDGNGNPVEPTSAQVAQWVADVHLFSLLKEDTFAYERQRDRVIAENSVTRIDATKL